MTANIDLARFEMRRLVEELRVRLSAVTSALAEPALGREELRRHAEELEVVRQRLERLADVAMT